MLLRARLPSHLGSVHGMLFRALPMRWAAGRAPQAFRARPVGRLWPAPGRAFSSESPAPAPSHSAAVAADIGHSSTSELAQQDEQGGEDVWVEQIDLSSGRKYYYSKRTLEFSITQPPGVRIVQGRISVYHASDEERRIQEARDKEDGWRVYVCPSTGRPFYYHAQTHKSQWENPLGVTITEGDYAGSLLRVPEDKLVAAPARKRALAALYDLLVAGGVAAGAGVFTWWELEHAMLGQFGAAYTFVAVMMARDMVFEQGTRSLGKRWAGVEIVTSAGQLPSRYRTFGRNSYLAVHIAAVELFPFVQLFAVGEALLCTLTKRGRRIGDYLSDTLVIEEQPDRQERLRDYSDYWMKRDSETDWRKLPTDIAEAMERAKMRRAKEREAEQL